MMTELSHMDMLPEDNVDRLLDGVDGQFVSWLRKRRTNCARLYGDIAASVGDVAVDRPILALFIMFLSIFGGVCFLRKRNLTK
jgi:hypothetical protein